MAGHRGSTFGQLLEPQPGQIDFENALSIALLKRLDGESSRVYLEDEGHLIGRIALPHSLRERMRSAPVVVVEESLEARIDVVVADYIVDLGQRFAAVHGAEGPSQHARKLQQDLDRIRKRLGGVRYQQVSRMMQSAFERQRRSGSPDGHRAWIALLLQQYYDPMYEYQLSRREGVKLFSGPRQAVLAWARDNG